MTRRPLPPADPVPPLGPAGVMLFSHGNSFPGAVYTVLMDAWQQAGWAVEAVPKYGHDPRYPVTNNWPHLRGQLLAHAEAVRQQHGVQRVTLVGHSLGGYLSLMAASRQAAWFDAVVLIDSPLLGGWRAHSVHLAKLSGLIKRVSPGRIAVKRRPHWPSRTAALAHFRAKRSFAAWDPQVLEDYIVHGLEDTPDAPPGSVQLAFKRDIEARIYNTLCHDMPQRLKRHPPGCPVGYIGGTRSAEAHQAGLAFTRQVVGPHLELLEGTHHLPMEQPQLTAHAVLRMLRRMRPAT